MKPSTARMRPAVLRFSSVRGVAYVVDVGPPTVDVFMCPWVVPGEDRGLDRQTAMLLFARCLRQAPQDGMFEMWAEPPLPGGSVSYWRFPRVSWSEPVRGRWGGITGVAEPIHGDIIGTWQQVDALGAFP